MNALNTPVTTPIISKHPSEGARMIFFREVDG